MADNKYNQSLLDMGYSQEQIDSMVNAVRSWQDANAVVRWTNQPPRSWDVDLSTYDGTDGKGNVTTWPWNANLNYNQYWDDSHPNQQSQRGWLNDKYTGEWTSNTYIAYNPDLRTSDLDPNYLYGQAAKDRNRQEAGYIARRNDNIASALYNEWRVSKEDVAQFLASQNEWMNSTEADRLNTIESVWKRLGQIKPQEEEPQKEYDPSIIENALDEDTSGRLYGKVTADEWGSTTGIDTLADANSVYKAMNEGRIANVKALLSTNSESVAYMMSEWLSPYWDQTMRDLQQYYPEKYQEIQTALKKIKWQQDVNNISHSGNINVTSQLTASENNVSTSMNAYVNSTASGSAAWQLSTNLNNALADSKVVSWAREQMEEYKRKIQEIQDAANDLPALANKYFKWDVPQYMVNAFINNRLQQYNKELEKYQNLYNASLQEAQMEIAQQQRREEMNYKWTSLQAEQNYRNANLELSRKELEYNRQKAEISNGQWNDDWTYSYVDMNWELHTLSSQEAKEKLEKAKNDLYNYSTEFIETWTKKIDAAKAKWQYVHWWQCESFSDNYTRKYYWTEMRWAKWWVTTAKEKAAYATESIPMRWFVAVWDYGIVQSDWVNYWHTGIVIDYNPDDWTFTTIESNYEWHWEVSIRKHSLNSANLIWFWNPTLWDSAKSWATSSWWSDYDFYDTPMRSIFVEASEWANDKTKDERSKISIAEQSYSTLYELMNEGYIDELVWIRMDVSEDDWNKFLWMLSDESFKDTNWNVAFDLMLNSVRKLSNWEDLEYALTRLRRLIEVKLRQESWAAINFSEWTWNFANYLPWAWQTSEFIWKKLRALEQDTIPSALPTQRRWKYIPIFTTYQDYVETRNKKASDLATQILQQS